MLLLFLGKMLLIFNTAFCLHLRMLDSMKLMFFFFFWQDFRPYNVFIFILLSKAKKIEVLERDRNSSQNGWVPLKHSALRKWSAFILSNDIKLVRSKQVQGTAKMEKNTDAKKVRYDWAFFFFFLKEHHYKNLEA